MDDDAWMAAVAWRIAEIANHPAAKGLNPGEREILAVVLENHPNLTIDEALAHLREAGM